MRRAYLLLIALLGGCAGDYPPTAAPPAPAGPHVERLGTVAGLDWTMRYEPETLTLEATCLAKDEFDDLKVTTLVKDEAGKELVGGEYAAGATCNAGSQAYSQDQPVVWPEGATLDITVTLKTAAGNQPAHWTWLKRDGKIAQQP